MTNLNTPQFFDIFNAQIPSEGPKAVPLVMDFSASDNYQITLTQILSLRIISVIQTVFIDNSVNSVPLTVNVSNSFQNIIVPAYSQGYYPILVPNNSILTFSCIGGAANTRVFLINVPLPSSLWSSAPGYFSFNASNYLQVSDPILDACIANNHVSTLINDTGDSGNVYPSWVGNITKVGSITASAANIITGSPGYFITGFNIYISDIATQATAGDITVSLSDSSTGIIYEAPVFIGTTAPANPFPNFPLTNNPGFLWNNKLANSTLSLNLSASLTAGTLKYTINYGITSIVG